MSLVLALVKDSTVSVFPLSHEASSYEAKLTEFAQEMVHVLAGIPESLLGMLVPGTRVKLKGRLLSHVVRKVELNPSGNVIVWVENDLVSASAFVTEYVVCGM